MKHTDWFDGSKFVPAHVGVYRCRGGYFKYWNGDFWCARANKEIIAEKFSVYKSNEQNIDWRGLAEEPK